MLFIYTFLTKRSIIIIYKVYFILQNYHTGMNSNLTQIYTADQLKNNTHAATKLAEFFQNTVPELIELYGSNDPTPKYLSRENLSEIISNNTPKAKRIINRTNENESLVILNKTKKQEISSWSWLQIEKNQNYRNVSIMYTAVDKLYRWNGFGTYINETLLAYFQNQANESGLTINLKTFIHPKNEASKALHKKTWFELKQRNSRSQQFVATKTINPK